MSMQQIKDFYALAQKDRALQAQINAAPDRASGIALVVKLAKERGFSFTPADLQEWIDQSEPLSDEELSEEMMEAVAGGAGCNGTTACYSGCNKGSVS